MTYLKRDFREPSGIAVPPFVTSRRSDRSWTISYRAIEPVAMVADALIILLAGLVSGVIYHLEFVKTPSNLQQLAGFAAVVAALFIALVKSRDLYTLPELLNFKSQIRRITIKWGIVFLFLTAVGFTMKSGKAFRAAPR